MRKWLLALGAATMALAAPAVAGHGGGGGGPHGSGGNHGSGGSHGGGGGGNHGGGGGGNQGGGGGHGGGGHAAMNFGGGGGGGHAFAMRSGGGNHGGGHGGGGHATMNFGGRHGGGGHAFAMQGGGGNRGGGRGFEIHHGGGERAFAMHGSNHAKHIGRGQDYATAMHGHAGQQHRFQQARNIRGPYVRTAHAEQGSRFERGQTFVHDHRGTLAFAAAGAGAYAGARYADHYRDRGVIDGCPPGLAAKNNGCMPPGQVRQQWGYGARLQPRYADSYLPAEYRSWYPDSDRYYYRYGDGYLYRVDRSDNYVSGLFPLAEDTGYYYPGEPYPAAYDYYNVPLSYQRYYPDGDDYDYRYGNGAIYQVNRSNGLIGGIVALLTGGLGVGQRLPAGYDVYNVPDPYRDRYYDTPNDIYRYADGNIYQVDPRTQIIQAIISALV